MSLPACAICVCAQGAGRCRGPREARVGSVVRALGFGTPLCVYLFLIPDCGGSLAVGSSGAGLCLQTARSPLFCPRPGLCWHFQPCSSWCLRYLRWQRPDGDAFPLPISTFSCWVGCRLHPWVPCGGCRHEDFGWTRSTPLAMGMLAGLGEGGQS